jgi:hypothetical protein
MSVASIYQVDKNQEVRRKRSFWVSLYLHIAILLLALFPFMIETPPFDVDRQQSVVIEFTNDAASSKQAAYKLESGPPAEAKQESRKAQPKVVPVESKPVETKVEQPKRPVEDIKIPVMTDPNSSDMPVEPDFEEPEPVEEEPVEVVKTPTKPAEKPTEKPVDAPEKSMPNLEDLIFGEEESGGSDPNKTEGDAKKSGGGGFDPYSQDQSDGSSPWGSGDVGTEVLGEGIFGRKVIKRADVAKMSKTTGTIAIKVCVNREGLVTEAVYLKEGSSITDPAQIRKAEDIAAQYRFEKDFSAPAKQCGKLTFKFTIKK